jgi:hypothetical protein
MLRLMLTSVIKKLQKKSVIKSKILINKIKSKKANLYRMPHFNIFLMLIFNTLVIMQWKRNRSRKRFLSMISKSSTNHGS